MKKNLSYDAAQLRALCAFLRGKQGCHTALLYGSRAIGTATKLSDYDVIGIRRSGSKLRIAKKVKGAYWDVFVYSERDVYKFGEHHKCWGNAVVLFEKKLFGKKLLFKLRQWLKKSSKPIPRNEIKALKVWAEKQLKRSGVTDIYGLYRRVELQSAAIQDYFLVRRKVFSGPKTGFHWLKKQDPKTFRLFLKVFEDPTDLRKLKTLVRRVYGQK